MAGISPNLFDAPATSLIAPSPPPAPAKPKQQMREFGDVNATRSAIFDRVLDAAAQAPPVSNQTHTLRLTNLQYADPDRVSLADQKRAILGGQTVGRRLRGTWELIDNASGNVLDQRQQVVATVPYFTDRGTYIHGGNEYTLRNQQRLRPGVFTRIQENGEIESHANILPGKGVSHRYYLDPEKGVFYLRLQQAKLPLMPLLKAMGATPQQLREAWGPDLLASNYAKDEAAAFKKLKEKLLKKDEQDSDDKTARERLVERFAAMEMDPTVTQRTLKKGYRGLDLDAILAITKKLVAVSKGEEDVDDRDALPYQQFLGPEDLFAERLARDHGQVRRGLLWKASGLGNLSKIPSSALKPQIEAALLGSGLGQALEEINPAEIYDKLHSISRLGEGGIPSIDSIPDEARNVQPSHMGYMDPLRTPECYDAQTEVMTVSGWQRWDAVDPRNVVFACLVEGQLTWSSPLHFTVEDYDGPMYGAETARIAYLVTPNHRMHCRPADYKCHDSTYRIELAAAMHGKHRKVQCGGHLPWTGDSHQGQYNDWFTLPVPPNPGNAMKRVEPIRSVDFCDLLGWYLSEGNVAIDRERHVYVTIISQSKSANPRNCARIEALLARLPFAWHYSPHRKGYVITGRQLAEYMNQFGLCDGKFIPEEVFDMPILARQRLLESLLHGDGRKDKRSGKTRQYCSTSRRLVDDVQRLLFQLGIASRAVIEPELREERYLDNYVVHIHDRQERMLSNNVRGQSHYFVRHYAGKVYCAQVPGGLLYVRRNGKTGFWCGNSFKVGVDLYLARNARKGPDGQIYTQLRDPRSGKLSWYAPQDIADKAVVTPNVFRKYQGYKRVPAMVGGKLDWVPKRKVDLVVPNFEDAFSPLGNLVPMKSAVKGQRVAMASRMLTQALPLSEPEAPLVQSAIAGTHGARSYEDEYARRMGALHAEQPGRVLAVSDDAIKVAYADGRTEEHELYQHFPFNRKTYIHQTAAVRPGDLVKPGQLLARSNYTDGQGSTALGRNLRTAYIPWGGKNFEDAAVISESAAKKLTSEHMYQHELEIDDRTKFGKRFYVSLFPGKFDRQALAKLDQHGVIKPGTTVEYGDPLVLAGRERDTADNKLHRKRQAGYTDASILWQHHDPGVVTDVVAGKRGPVVLVKSTSSMQVGDKLSGRYGDKGVVAAIVPDGQMPHDSAGQPFEILLNPNGVITRTNPAQKIELWLGKIAAKQGKPIKVEDWDDTKDLTEWALSELQKHGLSDTEDIIDPNQDRKIRSIPTGTRFFMKLMHTAESKGQARGGGAYTQEDAPAKGGPSGSKRVALLDTNALLSHGATETLRDVGAIRGQRNEDYWLQFMQGFNPRVSKVPTVYEKFVNQLRGAGINVTRKGTQTHIMALTDHDVNKLAGDREIQSGDTVNWDRGLKPLTGGLFDKQLTGGHLGNRWAAIKLHEPMPNPVMEEPIRRILGLTQKGFEEVLSGTKELPKYGAGPAAIAKALGNIDLDREITFARAKIENGSKSERDDAVRKLGYLKSTKNLGLHPQDWVLQRAPVLPPAFRPISMMQNDLPLVSDPNYLYKELFEANKNLAEMQKELGAEGVGQERLAVYHAFKAVTGLGDPISQKSREKNVKGLLASVFGSSPKFGTVQRKLISTTVDNVGRAVITPNPDFDMDTVGLPEDKAFDIYGKFVARRLKRQGMPLTRALEHIKDRSELAREALVTEMDERPVYINRAPVLHRFGIMAFRPQLVQGDTMQVSPLIVKGFNADFDGDAMQFHVPTDPEAAKEALERMLPSRNLLSPADFKTPVHVPGNEYGGGLYHASTARSKRPKRIFRNKADAIAAHARGDLDVDDPIQILE